MDANCNNCHNDALLSHGKRVSGVHPPLCFADWEDENCRCKLHRLVLQLRQRSAGLNIVVQMESLLPWALQRWLFAHGEGGGLIQRLDSVVIPCFLLKSGNEHVCYLIIIFFFPSRGLYSMDFWLFFFYLEKCLFAHRIIKKWNVLSRIKKETSPSHGSSPFSFLYVHK